MEDVSPGPFCQKTEALVTCQFFFFGRGPGSSPSKLKSQAATKACLLNVNVLIRVMALVTDPSSCVSLEPL